MRGRPPEILFRDARGPLLHGGIVDARAGAAAIRREAGEVELRRHGRRALVERAAQGDDFFQLLFGVRQPAPNLRIELFLEREVDGDVEQGAGWREPQLLRPNAIARALERRQQTLQVGAPHVTAVDGAERQHAVRGGGPALEQAPELAGRADQVHVQAVRWQGEGGLEVVVEPCEVGRQQQARAAGAVGEPAIRAPVRLQLGARAVQGEHRLIELNPARALGGQALQHLRVHGQQGVEQRQAVEPGRAGLP